MSYSNYGDVVELGYCQVPCHSGKGYLPFLHRSRVSPDRWYLLDTGPNMVHDLAVASLWCSVAMSLEPFDELLAQG